jgi:hypothetical protein
MAASTSGFLSMHRRGDKEMGEIGKIGEIPHTSYLIPHISQLMQKFITYMA